MTTLTVGATRIELSDDRLTTILPDGAEVPATPNHRPEDIARAQALGYGSDTAWMSRDHEITHTLLATWLGLPESPTMRGVAIGDYWPHWKEEEAAVLAIQRLCQTLGVDVLALAKQQAGPE